MLGIERDLQRRLIACWEIAHGIGTEVAACTERGIQFQENSRVAEIPSVPELDSRAEMFLYHAKLCLRDIARLFKPFFGEHFDENFKTFGEWVEIEYGPDHPIACLLKAERAWISQIISMRNGVEHPTHRRGALKIDNFRLSQNGAEVLLLPPVWGHATDEPSLIAEDMAGYVESILTFSEELLCCFLETQRLGPLFRIAEVPEPERDPAMPLRFKVVFTGKLPRS